MIHETVLSLSFNTVFKNYQEKWYKDRLIFSGELNEMFSDAHEDDIIRFISGGRKYKECSLTRCENDIEGWILHYSYEELNTLTNYHNGRIKISHKLANEVRQLYKEGLTQKTIAQDVGISESTIYAIINHKGRFKYIQVKVD